GGEGVPVQDARVDAKLIDQDLRLSHEMFDVTRLIREVEVACPCDVAFDPVRSDRFLDEGEGLKAGSIELATAVTVALEQRAGVDFVAGVHHAAVAAARAPTKLMLFHQRDRATTLGEARRRHHPGVTAADDHDIDLCWKRGWG